MHTDLNKIHTLTIPDTCAHERLDQALAKLMPEYSRTQIQAWIESGDLTVDSKIAKAKLRVKGGEVITLNAHLKAQPHFKAEAIPLTIVYEDDTLLIINKPIGMVVHPGAGNSEHTLLNALLHYAPSLSTLPRAGILHRLDKNTSGLLLVAKTPEAFKKLSHQLKKHHIIREYQAIVCGTLVSGGTVDAPISRHPLQRKKMTVNEEGKTAVTHYRVAEKYRNHTRLKLRLETGRTHQIRVHMAHIRHPIVGDPIYGGRLQLSKGMAPETIHALRQFKRQALHAFALEFMHPVKQEVVRFEIELPPDIKALMRILKEDMAQHSLK